MKQPTLILITIILCSISSIAQTTIKGTITDEINPLEWANIYIKNGSKGTTSDDQGNFTLDAKKGDTLIISYTGYKTKEIVIDSQKEVAVKLEGESLDEVIVVFQEIKMEKRPFGCFRSICNYGTCTYTDIKIETSTDDSLTKNMNPSLSPNPSSDGIFNLKMAQSYKEVQVYVTNLLGQQVQSKAYQNTNNSITVDLSSVRTGIYLINSIADGQPLPTQKAIRK